MAYENSTSVEQSYTSNTHNNSSDSPYINVCFYKSDNTEPKFFTLIIISIWLPLELVGFYSIFSQVKRDHVVPVYIINLLMSDVVQICCMAVFVANVKAFYTYDFLINCVYDSGLTASIFFMTLVSLERYLLIVRPLWYRIRQTTRASVSVSVVSWILSICIGIIQWNIQGTVLLLPLPFLIFFLVQTLRAVSAAQGVPADEKRRIVLVLIVVLLTYVVIFLPQAIVLLPWYFIHASNKTSLNFQSVSCCLTQLNTLADIVIYGFIKKWPKGKLLTFICCCRKNSDKRQHMNSITTTTTTTTCSGIVSQRQNGEESNP